MSQTTPPSLDQLAAALALLGRDTCLESALHLALPRHTAPGVEVRREAGALRWRNVSVPALGPRSAHLLGVLGWREGEEFLDLLSDNPADWVKPVVSGSHWVTFGTDVLFGLPLLRIPKAWPRLEVDLYVQRFLAGSLNAGEQYEGHEVETSPGYWTLLERAPVVHQAPETLPALARVLGSDVYLEGGRVFAKTPIPGVRVDLGVLRDGCSLEQSAPNSNYPSSGPCPPGWEHAAGSGYGPGRVRHTSSGLHGTLQAALASTT